MKVLVFGASGFIGFPVSQALLRAGHIVYGQTRSQDKAKQLAAEEIIPVVGEPTDVATWESLVESLDAVIEALAGLDMKTISVDLLNAVSSTAKKHRPEGAAKITYIYTSGTWVHGEDRKNIVTDTTPIVTSVPLVAWRYQVEQTLINSPDVNGIVIRPSMVYGRSGSIFAMMFKRAHDGKLIWPGKPGGRLAIVHQDDLADIYLRAAEKGAVVRGQIFDASNDVTESTDDILGKLVELSGSKPFEYVEPSNLYEEAIAATALVRPYLGRALLGWQPHKPGLAENLELYYNAWKANAGL